jgi:glycine oxidase
LKVAVLGGGVIGCAVAWRLRQRGCAVTIVERGPLGGGASHAAGGILAPQVEAHAPGPLFELARASRARYARLADELRETTGIDIGLRRDGTLVAGDGARFAWQREAGLPVERLSREALRALEPALALDEAVRLPDDHQVEPRPLVRALAAAALGAGAQLRVASARRILVAASGASRLLGGFAAEDARFDGDRASGVLLDDGALDADAIVLACGAWSSLVDGLPPAPRVEPLRGQMLELTLPAPLFRHVVFGDGGYLVPRADGRVLCGSSEEAVGFDARTTASVLERLLARARTLCPALAGATPTGHWAGLRPSTADQLPLLGPSSLPGLFFATGHRRNGILLAPITAEIVAACLTGERAPVELAPFLPSR